MPRLIRRLALLALLGVVVAPSPASAELSRTEWRSILERLDETARSRNWRGVADALRDAARDDSERAVDLVLRVGGRLDHREVQLGAAEALRSMESRDALEAMVRPATRERAWRMRLACLGGLHENGEDDRVVPVLIEGLEDREAVVQRFCVRALTERRDREAVEPLIDLMAEVESDQGRSGGLWADLKNSLGRLMGRDLSDATAYRGYWERHGDDIDPATVPEPTRDETSGGTVTLFGREIVCDRIVFILDVSGSMREADGQGGGRRGTGGRTRNNPGGAPTPEVPDELRRINRAKAELSEVIRHLSSDQRFNIIAYSSGVDFWQDAGLHDPSSGNVEDAIRWIEGLEADGVTVTDTAIRQAFDRIEEADCFYLLSDGFATHDGEDAVPTSRIIDMVADLNRFRQVQINTLGFEGADRDMMMRLAEATGGDYSDIE